MLSFDEFKNKLREGDQEKNSSDTEWCLLNSSNDEKLFYKLRNDILGPESILKNLLPGQKQSQPVQRKEIDAEFPKGNGVNDDTGQWLDDDGENGYLITWNYDTINLYGRKSNQDNGEDEMTINEMQDENSPINPEDEQAGDITSTERPLIDREAVAAAAHFMSENPDADIGDMVEQACSCAQDTEGAIEKLKTLIPQQPNPSFGGVEYSDDDMGALNDYRMSLRDKMFRGVLHTEPPGLEDMEGQPGVYDQPRLTPHVDDGAGEVIPDGSVAEPIPQNDDGVYVADLEENSGAALQKAAQLAKKAADVKARNDKKEATDQAKADAAKADALAAQAAEQQAAAAAATTTEEEVIKEADVEATTSQLGAALAGHGPESIGKALANIQREDPEKYRQILNAIPKEEQLDILDATGGGPEGTASSEDEEGDERKDVAGQLMDTI